MQFFLPVIYGFLYKMDSPFQTCGQAAKYHSLEEKSSPALMPTLVLIRSLYFSFGLGEFFIFCSVLFGFFGLIGYKSVLFGIFGIPLEALPFLTS